MKKLLSIGLTICITLSLTLIVKAQDKITVTLDGAELSFDVEPQIIDDFTMVPMRTIFESLGYSVYWYGDTKRIFAIDEDDNYIEMTIDSSYMYAGGNSKERASIILEIAPQIIDDRTLVPVRAVAEAGGCKVEWNGNSRTVLIKRVIEPTFFEGTIIPSIDSITPNAKLIDIMEMESGNKNYIYELNYDVVFEYVDFLKNNCRYQIIENEEEFISLGPSGIYDDYVFVDIWSDLGVFAVTPCCVEAPILPLQPQQPEDKEIVEINNNVDFINGIFDEITDGWPKIRTYFPTFFDYYNDLEYRLSFEMPDLNYI